MIVKALCTSVSVRSESWANDLHVDWLVSVIHKYHKLLEKGSDTCFKHLNAVYTSIVGERYTSAALFKQIYISRLPGLL